jgi:hypothetical protein
MLLETNLGPNSSINAETRLGGNRGIVGNGCCKFRPNAGVFAGMSGSGDDTEGETDAAAQGESSSAHPIDAWNRGSV